MLSFELHSHKLTPASYFNLTVKYISVHPLTNYLLDEYSPGEWVIPPAEAFVDNDRTRQIISSMSDHNFAKFTIYNLN